MIVGASSEDIETEFDSPDDHWAGGTAYVFLPVAGRYLESLRLRPRVDEKFAYLGFGGQVAMFGRYIAIKRSVGQPSKASQRKALVFTYTREGSTVLARGIAQPTSRATPTTSPWRSPTTGCWLATLATSGVSTAVQGRRPCTTCIVPQ